MLFKKKEKKKLLEIHILDAENNLIKSSTLNTLKLPEKLILDKCVEFYDDHNPCFIHRSAVITRILHDLEELVKSKTNKMKISDLPEEYKTIFRDCELNHILKII
jgi:hypothetical protein